MTTGLPLFDLPRTAPHVRGSATSAAGARHVEPELSGKRLAVLQAIVAAGDAGLTDNEGIKLTGMTNGWRARRNELAAAKLITECGSRLGDSGVMNVCWRATELGVERAKR